MDVMSMLSGICPPKYYYFPLKKYGIPESFDDFIWTRYVSPVQQVSQSIQCARCRALLVQMLVDQLKKQTNNTE